MINKFNNNFKFHNVCMYIFMTVDSMKGAI